MNSVVDNIAMGAQCLFGLGVLIGAFYIFRAYIRAVFNPAHPLVKHLLPFEPRKPVPWGGLDLVLLVILQLLCMVLAGIIVYILSVCSVFDFLLNINTLPLPAEFKNEHMVAQMLALGRESPFVLWLLFLAAVVLIPAAEEFYFRLLFQGYGEKREKWLARKLNIPCSRGVLAILVPAVIFASLHIRSGGGEGASPPRDLQMLVIPVLIMSIGYLLSVSLSVLYLAVFRKAGWADFGIRPAAIPKDMLVGTAAAVFLIPPIYLLQIGLKNVLKPFAPDFVYDPITLVFFAIGLGILYFRTHRILPCIIVHGIMNGTSFLLLYLFLLLAEL